MKQRHAHDDQLCVRALRQVTCNTVNVFTASIFLPSLFLLPHLRSHATHKCRHDVQLPSTESTHLHHVVVLVMREKGSRAFVVRANDSEQMTVAIMKGGQASF